MTSKKDIGLVFSGGGARGAYQIGVWKALKEMHLDKRIGAVYGTSVGAINGAAFVQGDFQKAIDYWTHIEPSTIFAHADIGNTKSTRKQWVERIKGAIKNKGVDVSPLKEMIRESIDEEKIRSSNLAYGLVVYNVTELKAKYLSKDEIPQGELIEYIIASATFPIFQPHRIGNQLYLDGGVKDNRPVNFFKRHKDIRQAIVVDVTIARHIWRTKPVEGLEKMVYVRPSRLLGSPLAFRHNKIMANMDLGYQDTRKQLAAFRLRNRV